MKVPFDSSSEHVLHFLTGVPIVTEGGGKDVQLMLLRLRRTTKTFQSNFVAQLAP